MRPAIIAKSVAKERMLLITAVSDMGLWFGLATIAVRSADNVVRLAIIIKSSAKVLWLLATAVSEAAP